MSFTQWFPRFSQWIKFLNTPLNERLGSYSSALVAITFILGTAVYCYPEPFKRRLFVMANYLTDKYLDFRYRNYDHKKSITDELHKP